MWTRHLNPFTAINCNALSAHVTRWRFLNCDSYLGTALCLCSGCFSAEARGTKMFSKAVLYPGLLLFVHQSLSWTVKAIYYHQHHCLHHVMEILARGKNLVRRTEITGKMVRPDQFYLAKMV